jgi:hypothetical protein
LVKKPRQESNFARALLAMDLDQDNHRLYKAVAAEVNDIPMIGDPGSEVSMFRPEPRNLSEMLKLPVDIRQYWLKADKAEIKNLVENNTFYLDYPREGERVYPTLSLYKVKLDSNGLLDKLKARIVVRGDLMKDNQPHGDPWSPTASSRGLKMFIADAARHKARIKQFDFIGAFLQAKMRYRMFVSLPAKYGELFPEYADYCGRPLLLNKSMYGTTYSGKMWYQELDDWLTDKEGGSLVKSKVEPCLYIKDYENGTTLKFLSYVDDGLLFCNDPIQEETFLRKMQERFDLKYMDQAHWFLGMRISQQGNYDITLDQSRYAKGIVERYLNGSNIELRSKPHSKPLPDDFIATKEDMSKTEEEAIRLEKEYGFAYSSVVGALIYILSTRPDLTFAVSKLAKFMRLPGKRHFEAIAHLLHYLREKSQLGLKYYSDLARAPLQRILTESRVEATRNLVTFSDSSWQDCPDTGRSTACYTVTYMGGVIDHSTHVPGIVALSSAEAEYNGACTACMSTDHHRMLLNELDRIEVDSNPSPIPILLDSKSAIAMSKSFKDTKHTRHIARRYHYVREGETEGRFKTLWIDNTLQISDIGTKNTTVEDLNSRIIFMMVEVS